MRVSDGSRTPPTGSPVGQAVIEFTILGEILDLPKESFGSRCVVQAVLVWADATTRCCSSSMAARRRRAGGRGRLGLWSIDNVLNEARLSRHPGRTQGVRYD